MRVSIEHREEAAGVSGTKRNYFVDCEVQLSEEERAIVRSRALYDHNFIVGGAAPPRSGKHFYGAGVLRGFAPLTMLVGVGFWIFHPPPLGGILFFVGLAMLIAGFVMDRKPVGDSPEQRITFKRLMEQPRFTIYGVDPANAKRIDDELRQQLAGMKELLVESVEIRAKQTFEL
jgi:hypothetical protein